MTFKEYMNRHDSEMLRNYATKGFISQQDVDDVQKMLDQGWAFQDALSVVQQQAGRRKTNNFTKAYAPADNRRNVNS